MLKELQQMKFDLGLLKKQFCSDEEQKRLETLKKGGSELPTDVFEDDFTCKFVRYVDTTPPDMQNHDIHSLLLYRQLLELRSIRKCQKFFVALIIICIIISVVVYATL